MCLRAITPVLLLSLLFSTHDSRAENIYAVLTQNLSLVNSSASEIEILDGDLYTLVNSFSIGTRSPTSIAVTPDQSQIFVADYTGNEIAVYAPNGFLLDTIAVTTPTDMALSPDGIHLYVSSGTSVVDFSTVTHGVIGSAGLSSDFANGISLSPDASTLAVATQQAGGINPAVYLLDASNLLATRIAISHPSATAHPLDTAFTDTGRALAWDFQNDSLYQVDVATATQLTADTILTTPDAGSSSNFNNALSYSSLSGRAYVQRSSTDELFEFNPASGSSATFNGFSNDPFVATLTPEEDELLISVIGAGDTLDVLDTLARTFTRNVYTFSNATMSVRDMVFAPPPQLHWVGASGDWDTPSNWTFGLTPDASADVFIDPGNGIDVNGPAAPTTVRSLAITARFSGTTTLTLQQTGPLTVLGTTLVDSSGVLDVGVGALTSNTLNLDGGTLRTPTMADVGGAGDFIFDTGTLNLTGPLGLTVGAAGEFGDNLLITAGQTIAIDNTTTIETGGKITVQGTFSSDLLIIQTAAQFDAPNDHTNNDEIQLAGPTARITGTTLTNQGFVSGEGRISATLNNTASGQLDVGSGETIVLTGSANTNDGQINVTGATLRVSGSLSNSASGFISGQGAATLRFDGGLSNTGIVGLSAANATIFGNLTNNANGIISLAGSSDGTFVGDLLNNGDVFTGSASSAVFLSHVSGAGNFIGTGNVEFVDGFSPGNSPASILFGGDVTFAGSSALEIEVGGHVAGQDYDQLNIVGNVTLGGTLNLIATGAAPNYNDVFEIIKFGSSTGRFSSINGALISATMTLAPVQTQTALTLVAALPGDGDLNGIVNFADFVLLANNFGSGTTDWQQGNFNLDQITNFADFVILANNFGSQVPSSSVPESTTLLSVVVGLLCAPARRLGLPNRDDATERI